MPPRDSTGESTGGQLYEVLQLYMDPAHRGSQWPQRMESPQTRVDHATMALLMQRSPWNGNSHTEYHGMGVVAEHPTIWEARARESAHARTLAIALLAGEAGRPACCFYDGWLLSSAAG